MNWLRSTALSILIIAAAAQTAAARVYVYEVSTLDRRFQTASKLGPDAYRFYHGGEDVIIDLKVVAVYDDKDYNKALKDYFLENNNANELRPQNTPHSLPRRPFYWWR